MTTPMSTPDFIYKIVSRPAFEAAAAAGVFPLMPIDLKDGYVHFSTAVQLGETLRLHFAGQNDVVVFAVRAPELRDLRWEPSRGGALFPHAYGDVPASVIGHKATVSVAADGSALLPDWVR